MLLFGVLGMLAIGVTGRADGCFRDAQVFLDMGDGDAKLVTVTQDNILVITPHNNDEKWKVEAPLNETDGCTAIIDFNVPGKPNPPPFTLLATQYAAGSNDGSMAEVVWEFTNPSGATPATPLNEWVMYPPQTPKNGSSVWSCPSYGAPTVSNGQLIVHDIHDGGEKVLTVVGKTILIQPYKNDEKWRVLATLDEETCTAVVYFNVPGKPNPPPCPLTMRWWEMQPELRKDADTKVMLEFSDPKNACKFDNPGSPLNVWIQEKPSV